jgi:prevent-host-death family protein
MEVSITKFRQELFELVNQALEGGEVWVTYKGRRFRIMPENQPAGRLARVTALAVINHKAKASDAALLEEMTRAWEQDWSTL